MVVPRKGLDSRTTGTGRAKSVCFGSGQRQRSFCA
uniref:Uncharacterized protein n=1 Tax=Rhizophora mucronata TaxID=61149 RepID=A0A2P2QN34_RHIMU